MKEYFEILGLRDTASYEEARFARIQLLKRYHPDLYAGNKRYAQLKSAEINEAFDVIKSFYESKESVIKTSKELKDLEYKKKEEKVIKPKDMGKNLLNIVIGGLILIMIILFFVLLFS